MKNTTMVRGLLAVVLVAVSVTAQADVFNMGGTISGGTWTGNASLSFVTVGNPGNVPDPATGGTLGSVSYTYQMGKYDVTVAQYTAFLKAVAKTDSYGLYNSSMGSSFRTQGISQTGSPGSYSYSVTGSNPQAANVPIFDVTWGDAARFCNWLCNGQPTGPEGNGTTETGAYTLSGDTSSYLEPRNAGAQYSLPSENEWYKAAYFDPSLNGGAGGYWKYTTKSNTTPSATLPDTGNNANYYTFGGSNYVDPTNYLTPVGLFSLSPGPYGNYDIGGDIWQLNEAIIFSPYRATFGGAYADMYGSLSSSTVTHPFAVLPTEVVPYAGFRVASSVAVPEPSTLALLGAGLLTIAVAWRRRKRSLKTVAVFPAQ